MARVSHQNKLVNLDDIIKTARWYFTTHYEVPDHLKSDASEIDRLCDALTIPKNSGFIVVCPICGWISDTLRQSYSRKLRITMIKRILLKHLKVHHINDKCPICNHVDTDVFEMLAHYLVYHSHR